MKRFACCLVFLCLVPLAQAQTAQTAQTAYTLEQVFAKMDEVAKTFRSTEANLERTHVTVLVNDKDTASGKFYYTRRGKEPRVKYEITKPIAQYLLIDKGMLQLYTPNLKQVQQGSLGEHSAAVEQFMALGFGQSSEDLKKNYEVTLANDDVLDGRKIDRTRPEARRTREWVSKTSSYGWTNKNGLPCRSGRLKTAATTGCTSSPT